MTSMYIIIIKSLKGELLREMQTEHNPIVFMLNQYHWSKLDGLLL